MLAAMTMRTEEPTGSQSSCGPVHVRARRRLQRVQHRGLANAERHWMRAWDHAPTTRLQVARSSPRWARACLT